MKCEKCHEPATFFYNETIGGHTKSLALCAACAAKAGLTNAENPFAGDLYSVLFHGKHAPTGKVCPTCRTAWHTIMGQGKVGCPDCYKTFREELRASIRQMHGNTTHVGRTPAGNAEAQAKETRIAALRTALKEAIAIENFEEAARLRDEIRAAEGA